MNGMDVFSYIESAPFEIANEALFYCMRAFDYAQRPKEWRPDIFFDHPSCLPGPEAQALTRAILSAIELEAQKQIDELDKKSFATYLDAIGDAGDILDAHNPPRGDQARVEEFFRQIREKWDRPRPVELAK